MKIKTGDKVQVLSGKDRGKTGKVIQLLQRSRGAYVVVEGVNLLKKHLRPRQAGQKGQIIELSAPIHASNVMVIDPKSNKPTRIGFVTEGDQKKRVAKRTGEFVD